MISGAYFWAFQKAALAGDKVYMIAGSVIWIGFTASMFVWLTDATGFEGLVPIFLLFGASAPSLAFAAIGGLVGWLKRRRNDGHNLT